MYMTWNGRARNRTRDSECVGNADWHGVTLTSVALYSAYLFVFCSCDGSFINSLKQYIENDAGKDAAIAAEEGTDMNYLKRLLDESVRDLDR